MKVPKTYQKYVKEIYKDCDGIWVKLNDGYITADGTTIIAQDNMKEIITQLKYIKEVIK